MRKVIAYKEQAFGALGYIAFIGIDAFAFAWICASVPSLQEYFFNLFLMGVLMTLTSGGLAICFRLFPTDLIVLTDNDKLLLPNRAILSLEDIYEVVAIRSSARCIGGAKWGTVVIVARSGEYRYESVANCENVEKELTRLMHEAKKKRYKIKGERKL